MTETTYMPTSPEAVAQLRNAAHHVGGVLTQDYMLRRDSASAWMLGYWDLTDAIIEGVEAVKFAGSRYLPKFTEEDSGDYDNRLNCTKMTNVYRDGVEGLASKPFEKEVELVDDDNKPVPQSLLDFIEDVDGSGNNLTVYASQLFFNGINSAIHWIFVDHPEENPNVRSIADAKKVGARPYWSHVLGRNVLEARSKIVLGEEVLTYVRIFEPGKIDHVREFERLDSGTIIWTLSEKREQWLKAGTAEATQFHKIAGGTVTIDVIPLVPFITGRRDGRTFKLWPALRDAADLQINLYQNESALEWIKRLSAYPMLAGNGVRPPTEADGKTIAKLRTGPNRVLYSPPSGAGQHGEWKFVQPEPGILTFLAADIKDTIMQLRELIKQPLTAQSGNLTVITTAVAAGKAASAVGGWALTLKDALENALVITNKFLNIKPEEYDPTVSVYTDFDQFSEGDVAALQSARVARDISGETFINELKRRRILSDEVTYETEAQRLLKEVPADDGTDTGTMQDDK